MKIPSSVAPRVLSSMYKIHLYTSCGLECHDHKWKLQAWETPRRREGNRCSWLRVTQRVQSQSRHSRRGARVHFHSCCSEHIDQNRVEAFLIHIWKSQVFLHVHEQDFPWVKILLETALLQTGFSLWGVWKARIISTRISWAQPISQCSFHTTCPSKEHFWTPLFHSTESKGHWFGLPFQAPYVLWEHTRAQSDPFPVWLGYAHLNQRLFPLCTLVLGHLAAVFVEMRTSSNQCGRKTKAKAHTGTHRAEQESCIIEENLERAFFGFLKPWKSFLWLFACFWEALRKKKSRWEGPDPKEALARPTPTCKRYKGTFLQDIGLSSWITETGIRNLQCQALTSGTGSWAEIPQFPHCKL